MKFEPGNFLIQATTYTFKLFQSINKAAFAALFILNQPDILRNNHTAMEVDPTFFFPVKLRKSGSIQHPKNMNV